MTGHQVRAMREALGLTVQALASAVGVTGQGVRNWEHFGEMDAKPRKRSRKWAALVAFLSAATPTAPAPTGPVDPLAAARVNEPATAREEPAEHDPAGLLWPWLPTAGEAYRARVRAIVRAA